MIRNLFKSNWRGRERERGRKVEGRRGEMEGRKGRRKEGRWEEGEEEGSEGREEGRWEGKQEGGREGGKEKVRWEERETGGDCQGLVIGSHGELLFNGYRVSD